jgi:hypothetical protein
MLSSKSQLRKKPVVNHNASTPEEIRNLVAADYEVGMKIRALARKYTLSRKTIHTILIAKGFKLPTHKQKDEWEPEPGEVAARVAAVQLQWSPKDRRSHDLVASEPIQLGPTKMPHPRP